MPAMTSLVRRAEDKKTMYITLGVVFGIIGFICLVVTVVLMSRLRRHDRKLDRELVHNNYDNNKDFAPQFSDKGSFHEPSHSREHSHDYPRAEDFPMPQNYPRPPMPPPSIPADILHHGKHDMYHGGGQDMHYDMHMQQEYDNGPHRPMRRPSSLFDNQRNSITPLEPQSFAYQQRQPREHHNSVDSYMPPMWQAPPPTHRPYEPVGQPIDLHITAPDAAMIEDDRLQRPPMPQRESSYSIYSAYGHATTAGTEAPPIQVQGGKVPVPVARAPSLGRSPSMLRKLLHDRAAKAGMPPPMPPMPEPQPAPTQQQRSVRPDTTLMPYDLETATPGPTPIDVPPPSAVVPSDQRHRTYATQPGMMIIEEEDPFSDSARTPTAIDDRLTLLQPPPSPPRRSPPPLTITIPNSHTKGMTASNGSPPQPSQAIPVPPIPVRSPERTKAPRKPVLQRPPAIPIPQTQQLDVAPDLNGTVTPDVLAQFAARLRPETREFNAVPVAIPDTRDDGDFRITMRS